MLVVDVLLVRDIKFSGVLVESQFSPLRSHCSLTLKLIVGPQEHASSICLF